ncbi:aspartyl/asparaginyl beta-hydroxylase domain-containing protein [Nocardia brasiliensis]|uniref:aspartyl/asparaginyl beta-hydroxylase domain-containing protein n=1 Tax=Nocardia brasiliensis TaxID=37326 RepID=UPI002456D1F1|nr:aspartyl/asparaginyl beta-hydroxylase domain-containing protein [Nocardia brasiliensis]
MKQLADNAIAATFSETRGGEFYRGADDAIFDLNLLREAYEQVIERVGPLRSTRGDGAQLSAVSLTHRRDADDPMTDGLESQFAPDGTLRYLEREFCCFNTDFVDTYFSVIHRCMQRPVGRMRLMIMRPRQVYPMHADASKRAHLAIHTAPDTYLVGPDGHGHHVPADGRVRVFDTRLRHTAFNASDVDRVHLVMSMADTERLHHTASLRRI